MSSVSIKDIKNNKSMEIICKVTDVLALIVTFNRANLLKRSIKGILDQSCQCDILIINNKSTDETQAMLDTINNKCVVSISLDSNVGCPAGISIGLDYAIKNNYKYVWILDDDMIPEKQALEIIMHKANEMNDWGCLSGGVYWINGDICKPNIPKKNIFSFVKTHDYQKDRVLVQMVSWGSMFIKVDVIKHIGYPIKDYYIYTDDYEYSMRISKEYNIYLIPESRTIHYIKKNRKTSVVKDSSERIYRYEYLFRNDMEFYRRQGFKGYLYILLKICFNVLKIIFFADDSKKDRILCVVRGVKEGMKFRPAK